MEEEETHLCGRSVDRRLTSELGEMIEVRERFKEGKSPPLMGLRKKEHKETHESLRKLIVDLEIIRADSLRLERELGPRLAEITEHKMSARNLVHYLALRRQDIRPLQEQLAALGLSSLGRTESHVLGGVESLLKVTSSARRARVDTVARRRTRREFRRRQSPSARKYRCITRAAPAETQRPHYGDDAARGGR